MPYASERSELQALTVAGWLSKKEMLWQMPWLESSRGFPFSCRGVLAGETWRISLWTSWD
jgi:hypothetical protein